MRARWWFALGFLLSSSPAVSRVQAQLYSESILGKADSAVWPAVQMADPLQQPGPSLTPLVEEIEDLEEEVGDRDPTYLRTRTVLRYDHRSLGPASIDRFRFRLLYGFGPKQRYAVSFLEPIVQIETPAHTARGSGDAEAQFNANIQHGERFRTGVAMQATLQTSSDALIGGATTTVRPSIDFTGVFSSRLELVTTLYYKQSIHTARGIPFKQFEPDVIVNTRAFDTTWFLEWDSYYDSSPGRLAQTLKPGVSRAFGPKRRFVASAYYAIAINDYARLTQYRYDAGVDVTWYPRKHR